MEIKVSGRHMDVTDAIRDYASEKVSKLPRYFDRVQEIKVVLDRQGDQSQHSVEIIVEAERVYQFVASASGADLYACIDEATEKIERQLTDHKEKIRNHKHKSS